ncbi:hypothetical protein [Thomasclavelia sp.]|uniref:hypothetical protein n=1 Tax=Thomasclavelia sp. TaxID=3025757 RepID=UPI0025E49A8F|nr:hypothetical protein [Thomasclavelia sp.]
MFRGLFKKHEEDEDIFEVDPVVEQRRKEKFSSPLIYDEEFQKKEANEKAAATKSKVSEKPKTTIEKKPAEQPKVKTAYQMSEVISPMNGLTKNSVEKKVVKLATTKQVKRKKTDQLVPVISPYFGDYEEKKPIESQATLTTINEEKEEVVEEVQNVSDPVEKLPTVEDNLRNIAKIIEEEQDQLKIIEERTGEFKLNFESNDSENKDSLIDEIDDNMSLDELMSLYEKKFKD